MESSLQIRVVVVDDAVSSVEALGEHGDLTLPEVEHGLTPHELIHEMSLQQWELTSATVQETPEVYGEVPAKSVELIFTHNPDLAAQQGMVAIIAKGQVIELNSRPDISVELRKRLVGDVQNRAESLLSFLLWEKKAEVRFKDGQTLVFLAKTIR